ncbi:hypothetical protein N474_14545 [Pseudoalteromonas luteoviolacea CPMOR-2]|jgi:hypothetical protein|uniref:hypothetical protein n=1 Tax=Pseudoalteromonas luteoviolacea TaxID=43657 RepID=UPI0007B042DD|nr:hypothetical protein [Pseudoalteromonas luteoviolacea]KZN55763.1 hypothetical protein N474_14545 [Pseudoalteromonas luteoviolacea CPMOR-2]
MTARPFLTDYTTQREAAEQSTGYYCHKKQMWMDVDKNRPAIEMTDSVELTTKTKVNVEEDDESVYRLELVTKTHVNVERDDTSSNRIFFF